MTGAPNLNRVDCLGVCCLGVGGSAGVGGGAGVGVFLTGVVIAVFLTGVVIAVFWA